MLSLAGIAFVAAERPGARLLPEEVALVRRLAAQTIKDTLFPQGWLLEARSLRPNVTGSFLASSVSDVVAAAGLGDITQWCSQEHQRFLLAHGLELAGAGDPGLDGWRLVLMVARFCKLPEDHKEALRAAIARSAGDLTDDEAPFGDVIQFVMRQSATSIADGLRAAATLLFEDALDRHATIDSNSTLSHPTTSGSDRSVARPPHWRI